MLAGGTVALFLLANAGAALAQNYNPSNALSSSHFGAMKCSDFTHLNVGERTKIVNHIAQAAPVESLSTQLPTPPTEENAGTIESGNANSSEVPGTPLSAGELIAACEAAPFNSTLEEAYSRTSTHTNLLTNG
jgi:hypothetical protein